MIDFHTHVLPCIDDGSRGTDMSMDMLQASYNYGIDVMVATPHFYIRHNDVQSFLRHRHDSYRALMHKAESRNTPIPDIRLGAEVFFFAGMSSLEDLDKLCIEGTRYLLLEMPFMEWSEKVISEVEKLVYDCSITPIIAHLDRYLSYQSGNDHIMDLIRLGALIQMNGDYVNGLFTRKKAIDLIKDGVVSLLGSDCHNMQKRAPNLGKTFDIIRRKCGQETLDRIDSCGREILNLRSL